GAHQASQRRQIFERPLLGAGGGRRLKAKDEHERGHRHSFRGRLLNMAGSRLAAITLAALLVLASVIGLRQASRAADELPLRPAQIALFKSDHLAKIRHPGTLDYGFRHDGREPYDDTVLLVVRDVREDGAKDIAVEF